MESNNNSSSVLDNYEYCGNVKRYLETKLKGCGKGVKELTLASGYAQGSSDKFKRHCSEWHELFRPIPRKYLGIIGGKIEDIQEMVALDMQDFEEVCKIPRFVSWYIVRIFCAVFKREKFMTAMNEEDAIEKIKAYSIYNKFRCCINNYCQLVTISIEPDGSMYKHFYKPEVKITKQTVVFKGHGALIGRSYIGKKEINWSSLLSL